MLIVWALAVSIENALWKEGDGKQKPEVSRVRNLLVRRAPVKIGPQGHIRDEHLGYRVHGLQEVLCRMPSPRHRRRKAPLSSPPLVFFVSIMIFRPSGATDPFFFATAAFRQTSHPAFRQHRKSPNLAHIALWPTIPCTCKQPLFLQFSTAVTITVAGNSAIVDLRQSAHRLNLNYASGAHVAEAAPTSVLREPRQQHRLKELQQTVNNTATNSPTLQTHLHCGRCLCFITAAKHPTNSQIKGTCSLIDCLARLD